MRSKIDMKTLKPEAMADYYLEKMLSDSAQFRAYNEFHQDQKHTKRVQQKQARQENRGRLRALQNELGVNPVIYAISNFFNTKKSA
ncbi:MAG: hypothetical protein JST89_19755 [Cyanobacteria bacterium SZAS-4]|nr:hypothetical protein [Cyanobacteria bacterium SZAS-4]